MVWTNADIIYKHPPRCIIHGTQRVEESQEARRVIGGKECQWAWFVRERLVRFTRKINQSEMKHVIRISCKLCEFSFQLHCQATADARVLFWFSECPRFLLAPFLPRTLSQKSRNIVTAR